MTIMIRNYEGMIEMIARFMAAKELKLESDFYGDLLPPEVWVKHLAQAESLLDRMIAFDRSDADALS